MAIRSKNSDLVTAVDSILHNGAKPVAIVLELTALGERSQYRRKVSNPHRYGNVFNLKEDTTGLETRLREVKNGLLTSDVLS